MSYITLMYYYKATVQYDGTDYCGFQWQKDLRTIQNEINQSLSKLLSGKISTMGASRTDTGVHAVEQFVKITTEHQIECESFILKLNLALPPEIKCLKLVPCQGAFRPATDHALKEYRYLFTNTLRSGAVDKKFIANHPYTLDIDQMIACAGMVVGRHDFRNFCSAGSNVKTTVREITFCEISKVDPHAVLPLNSLFVLPLDLGQCYQLRIEGKGFLKQMVRHLMRALWLVGSGKISPEAFSLLITGPEKIKRLWKVAPPSGLFLYKFKDELKT